MCARGRFGGRHKDIWRESAVLYVGINNIFNFNPHHLSQLHKLNQHHHHLSSSRSPWRPPSLLPSATPAAFHLVIHPRAYYHDAACQRNHYPAHKAECRRAAAASSSASARPSPSSPNKLTPASSSLVEFRTVEGRSDSIVALKKLSVGCHPFASTTQNSLDGLCASFVHPVLYENK